KPSPPPPPLSPPLFSFATVLLRRVWKPCNLETQASGASRFGQGRNAAVILVVASIELDLRDAGGQRLLGDQAADRFRRLLVAAVLEHVATHALFDAPHGDQRLAGEIVDHLAADVP